MGLRWFAKHESTGLGEIHECNIAKLEEESVVATFDTPTYVIVKTVTKCEGINDLQSSLYSLGELESIYIYIQYGSATVCIMG